VTTNTKLIIWHIVVAIVAWVFWADVAGFLKSLSLGNDNVSFAVFYLGLLVSLVILGFVFFPSNQWAFTLSAIVGIVYLLVFGSTLLNWLGLGIFVLLALYARHRALAELEERIKFNSRIVIRRGVPALILGIFVLVSFIAFQSPSIKALENTERLPTVTEKYIRVVVENTIGRRIQDQSPQQKEQIISLTIKKTLDELNSLAKPFFKFAPPILSSIIFLVLLGFIWLFILLSVIIGVILFWILKKSGFVKFQERDVKAEALLIKM